jgi:predicted amidohydrolase
MFLLLPGLFVCFAFWQLRRLNWLFLYWVIARAIENQCYVIAAAQCGKHNEKRESYGHSIAIDPWGTVLADAGGMDDPPTTSSLARGNMITCEIDLDTVSSVRERMPIQQHREQAFMAASMDD